MLPDPETGPRPGSTVGRDVSVVIATRDRPELLRRAVESVSNQEHDGRVEIVVVFDRSTPDLSLARAGGGRSVVVATNVRSPGLAGARNSGVALAAHEWIAFCDDDDEWLPGKLAAQFRAMEAVPGSRVATTGVHIRYQGSDTTRIPVSERLTYDGFLEDRMTEVHPSATLVARSVIDEIGEVDEHIPGGYAEDYDWLMRAAQVSPIAVAAEPLVRVHWHGGSFFFERWKTIDEALQYLVDKHPRFVLHPRGLARVRGQQAVARAAMGDRSGALRKAWAAFRLSPTERRVPVAVLVVAGVPAGFVLKMLHRFGKGI